MGWGSGIQDQSEKKNLKNYPGSRVRVRNTARICLFWIDLKAGWFGNGTWLSPEYDCLDIPESFLVWKYCRTLGLAQNLTVWIYLKMVWFGKYT